MMKKFLLLSVLCWAGLSCSKSEGGEEPLPEPATYVVTLKPAGDIAPFVPSGTGDDLYGVQIYAKPRKGEGEYKPYAYGQFYDVSKMQVELSNQYKYRIVCTAWRNHKGNAEKYFWVESLDKERTPFQEITNTFILSTQDYLYDLGDLDDYNVMPPYNGDKRDLYHFQQNDFIPKDRSPVSLDMRHVSFRVRMKVTGMTNGRVGAHLGETINPQVPSFPDVSYPETESEGGIFALFGFGQSDRWAPDAYKEEMGLIVTWREGNYGEGLVWLTGPNSNNLYTFRGNKLYTITADVPSKTFTVKEEPFPAGGM